MFFLFPYADENRTRSFPFITIILILANCAVYAYQYWLLPQGYENYISEAYGLVPYEVTHFKDIGPVEAPYSPYANILFYMFLHGGLLHLVGNMLFLWIYGDNVEDRMGHFRYLVFYIFAGVVAALVQILFGPYVKMPTIGASGAVAGVMGAYFRWFPHARIRCLFIFIIFPQVILLPAVIVLGIWILMQIVNAYFFLGVGSSATNIAWFAHIGGFASGVIYVTRKQRKMRG